MENLEMAFQYQKDNLNDLNQLLIMKQKMNTKISGKAEILAKADNLAQYLGNIAPDQKDLLTNKHFDIEYYTLVKMYWMKSHLLELRNNFTGSINNLNEIMKTIDEKYGK
mmetsp:Transcript_11577/g.13143  ORF Transcript_11577/g.13143 Transcript_11577/m.13143 type:complete len:110 (-) Transcript_11577:708-1037(-)